MFILKFVKSEKDGIVNDVVSCNHYSLYEKRNGLKIVTTYSQRDGSVGVERCVGEKMSLKDQVDGSVDTGFSSCFVMNYDGKTIDTIKSKEKSSGNGSVSA